MNAELPKEIETYIDENILFNKFGIVNIGFLKSKFKCELENDVLQALIQERFGKEMNDGKIEFITNTKK